LLKWRVPRVSADKQQHFPDGQTWTAAAAAVGCAKPASSSRNRFTSLASSEPGTVWSSLPPRSLPRAGSKLNTNLKAGKPMYSASSGMASTCTRSEWGGRGADHQQHQTCVVGRPYLSPAHGAHPALAKFRRQRRRPLVQAGASSSAQNPPFPSSPEKQWCLHVVVAGNTNTVNARTPHLLHMQMDRRRGGEDLLPFRLATGGVGVSACACRCTHEMRANRAGGGCDKLSRLAGPPKGGGSSRCGRPSQCHRGRATRR
jgi:hypothetical protein